MAEASSQVQFAYGSAYHLQKYSASPPYLREGKIIKKLKKKKEHGMFYDVFVVENQGE